MTIVLIGVPDAGKTTARAELVDLLGRSFVDVGARIEEVVSEPVAEIFADDSEARFRALEESVTLGLLEIGEVMSLDGGAVVNPRIRETLAGHDVTWLEVPIRQASRRVRLNTVRPLSLDSIRERLIELLRERIPVYEAVSTTRVNIDQSNPKRITAELVEARRQP